MAGYLKEPVVLQWDMKTGSYGKIVQHIIEKKVCELDPIYVKGIMYCLFSRVVLRNCMITDDFVFSKGRVIITF